MVNRLRLFIIIFAIPLIGFGVAEGIQAHFNAQLRSVILEKYPDADRSAVSQVSLDRLCENPSQELQDICSTNSNLNLMSTSALLAGAVGLALLIGIWVAGFTARENRRVLLYLFKPGLYLTIVMLIGLVIINAAVAMGAIYYLEAILFNRVHLFIIGAIGLGAAAGIIAMTMNAFTMVKNAQTFVIGRSIPRKSAPRLWKYVDSIAAKIGALHPEHIVVGLDPNFFVTEAEVTCLDEHHSGRTLYCSLPLCRIMTTEELSAVIGHELGHFKGLDTSFSQKFYPIYRGTASSIYSLQATGGGGARMIALLPAIAVLGYFLESFSIAETKIGRERELAADQQGAVISNKKAMASALVKLHAFAGFWNELQRAAAQALHKKKYFVNVSKTYADGVSKQAKPEVLKGIAEAHLSHPTDTHPPLADRLKALELAMEDVTQAALKVKPKRSAITLLPNAIKIEKEVSGAYQAILAQRLGIDLEE